MPIVNGKYQSPQWRNGGPPALGADELNAISDTLEKVDSGSGGGNYQQGNGILIEDDTISARLSTKQGNAATFGTDGGLYVQASGGGSSGGGKKVAVVVGTSQNGWTSADCDYLCDGVNDQIEINQAIESADVGQVLLLPGTYNIGNAITIGNDISLCGGGPFVSTYNNVGTRGPVVIKDERDWYGARGNPASASLQSAASNLSLFNITLDSISTSRCGIYASGNLTVSYCNILTRDHCIYSSGYRLAANFSMVGQTGRADLAEACGIYMVPSSGLVSVLDINGSTVTNVVSLYYDISGMGSRPSGMLQFANSRFIGGAPDSSSGNITIKGAKNSAITGCYITGSSTVGRETSVLLDSDTSNIILSGNVLTGPIVNSGSNNYTQNNLIVE